MKIVISRIYYYGKRKTSNLRLNKTKNKNKLQSQKYWKIINCFFLFFYMRVYYCAKQSFSILNHKSSK